MMWPSRAFRDRENRDAGARRVYRSLARQSEPEIDAEGEISAGPPAPCRKVEGAERISTTVMIDQSPSGARRRSNP